MRLLARPIPKFDSKKDFLKILTKNSKINKKHPEKKDNKSKFPKKSRYELSCGPIIFNIHTDKPLYLLVQYPTYWGFVKGKVEPGETEENTAFRETYEEVGLSDLQFIGGFRESQQFFFKGDNEIIRKEVVYLLARTSSWKIKLSYEHLNFKWCTFEDALKLMRIKGTREILVKAHEYLQKVYRAKF